MEKRILTSEKIEEFREHLTTEERSPITIEKYVRDIRRFTEFIGDSEVTKELVVAYKQALIMKGYAVRSINTTMIYIMTTELEHRKKIERLGLVV